MTMKMIMIMIMHMLTSSSLTSLNISALFGLLSNQKLVIALFAHLLFIYLYSYYTYYSPQVFIQDYLTVELHQPVKQLIQSYPIRANNILLSYSQAVKS